MKKLLITFMALITTIGYTQDMMLQKTDDKLDDNATEIAQEYTKELGLTGKQFMLFQKKVEEFLIRREKIERAYNGKEKLDMLFTLQEVETREMNDILTRPQMQLYKKIKPDIQPLAKTKSE